MIIESLIIGGGYLMASAIKSSTIDERALKKYAKAFEKNEEAQLMFNNKTQLADKRLLNVVKKKKSIMDNTFPKFVDVYGQIQKIDLGEQDELIDKISLSKNTDKIATLQSLSVELKKNFSNKEAICSLLTIMVKDSERYLSAANNQLRASNVVYFQAESICSMYDAIIARADRVANLLVGMNVLFIKSIEQTRKTINEKGLNVRSYSDYDKGILMTCVNFAAAIADIVHVPVVTNTGEVPEIALKTIKNGEEYLKKINDIMLNY